MVRAKHVWQPWLAVVCVLAVAALIFASYIEGGEERVPTPEVTKPQRVGDGARRPHVPELAKYLDRLSIRKAIVYRSLAVFPVVLERGAALPGKWLTMDAAIQRKVLLVTEKEGGGTVPVIFVENRSPTHHIFIMAGEVISGGKQTRTIRKDVILSPGQKVDVGVFCVEAGRWRGKANFIPAGLLAPQSIQKELRKGTTQGKIWADVAYSNMALDAENFTDSLAEAVNLPRVQKKLAKVRKTIVPEVPKHSVGFIFVHRGRAVGAEFFGSTDIALALLPKLIDSYAVDLILKQKDEGAAKAAPVKLRDGVAEAFLARIKRVGSRRSKTPGSGAGIRTKGGGLVGDGVSIAESVVHYGCQIEERIVPVVKPIRRPPSNLPEQLRQD